MWEIENGQIDWDKALTSTKNETKILQRPMLKSVEQERTPLPNGCSQEIPMSLLKPLLGKSDVISLPPPSQVFHLQVFYKIIKGIKIR